MPRLRPEKPKNYNDWRNRVLERDLFACQKCGKTHHQSIMSAHHRKNYIDYPLLRLVVENGITLCLGCHKKCHRKGWRNAI
jgi:hypothetical protein